MGLTAAKGGKDNLSTTQLEGIAFDDDDCCLCLETLPKLTSKLSILTCCGKALHLKCGKKVMASKTHHKLSCFLCRAPAPKNKQEHMSRVKVLNGRGKPWSFHMMGDILSEQHGPSSKEALEYYEISAKKGYPESQYNLGYAYGSGNVMCGSLGEATKISRFWYEKSAEQGYALAQVNLAVYCANGKGGLKSYSKAREWLMKAATQGCKDAIPRLFDLGDAERGTTTDSKAKRCATCGTPETTDHKLHVCKRCHVVFYCNKQHQIAGWKCGHKKECNK